MNFGNSYCTNRNLGLDICQWFFLQGILQFTQWSKQFRFYKPYILFILIKTIVNTTSIQLPWSTSTLEAMAATTSWMPAKIFMRTFNFSQRKPRNIRFLTASGSVSTLSLEPRLCHRRSIMPSRLGNRQSYAPVWYRPHYCNGCGQEVLEYIPPNVQVIRCHRTHY